MAIGFDSLIIPGFSNYSIINSLFMKKFFTVLSLSLAAVSTMQANVFTTSGDGTTYTLASLAKIENSGVTADGYVYTLSDSLVIADGDQFQLDDNAVLKLADKATCILFGDASFEVSAATITRTDDDAKPNQIELRKADAVYGFQNVTFEYVGVKSFETNSLYFDNCTFTQYVYQNRVSGPIAIGMTGSKVVVTNCLFDRNEYSSVVGAANIKCSMVRVENCTFNKSQQVNRNMPMLNLTPGDSIIVRGNVLHGDSAMDMVGGISVANLMGLEGPMYVLIEDNEIDSCRYGINIQGAISEAIIRGNRVTNNRFVRNNDANNGGSGIAIYDASKSLNLKVSNNYFENNLWGVTVIGGGNINLGKIEVDGVALAEDDPEYNVGRNTFKDNGHDDILVDLAFASGTDYLTVYAQNNTWNVAEQTEEQIEAVIDHQKDDATLGLAIYMPAYVEQTTGVSAIESVQPSGAAFDLMGRSVERAQKGQLYIREGRKFIVR